MLAQVLEAPILIAIFAHTKEDMSSQTSSPLRLGAEKMSGLIGAVDKAYHHVKGDQAQADEKHSVTGVDALTNGNLGGFGAAQVGTTTGQSMGGNSFGNTV
ncbi:hypothetical protein JCM11491_000543 [Sporobolomyces phaffii]